MHWYIRKNNKVTGPFPPGHIQQSLLLGRITLNDEVSQDRAEWVRVDSVKDLIPEVMLTNNDDDFAKERLRAARRWADERRGERRDESRAELGRRKPETHDVIKYRKNRENLIKGFMPGKSRGIYSLVIVFIVLAALIYIGVTVQPPAVSEANCQAPATKGVNWSNCNLAGIKLINIDLEGAVLNSTIFSKADLFSANLKQAQLLYADLSQANLKLADLQGASLKGANLRGADLSRANLVAVDLSYANLEDAVLDDADLINANLEQAIWIDGKICQRGSVGKCVTQ